MSLFDPTANPPDVRSAQDLLARYVTFLHPDDRDWWIAQQDAYLKRLVAILHACDQGLAVTAGYRQLLMENVVYVCEFLPIYSTPTGQAAVQQGAALLLTPTEYHWLTESPGSCATGLRRNAMGRYAPDIHQRSQWDLARDLNDARHRGDISARLPDADTVVPMLGATQEELMRALAGPLLPHRAGGLPAAQWAMVCAAQLKDAEIFWVCNSRHAVAESLRATWMRLRQEPESDEHSSQFMRGIGLMRDHGLLQYEPSQLYQRLLLGKHPAGATIEAANRAAACARSLTEKEANWIFTAEGPAAQAARASLAALWGDPTWGEGLPDFALRVATMRMEGLVDQSEATGHGPAAPSTRYSNDAPIISSEGDALLQHILERGSYDNTVSSNSDVLNDAGTSAILHPMASQRETFVLHQDDALSASFYADSVVLLLWRRPINLASVQALGSALEEVLRDRSKAFALLSVVSPEAQASFENAARQLNVQLILRYQHTLTTAVAVIEGGGPRAALLRAATRLVLLASPRWLDAQIRNEVAVGCTWLADHFAGVEAAELTAAVESMRRLSTRVAV